MTNCLPAHKGMGANPVLTAGVHGARIAIITVIISDAPDALLDVLVATA